MTTMTNHLPTEDEVLAYWDRMTEDPRWGGWGYLGERSRWMDEDPALVATVDEALLDHMADWSDEERFQWANSRPGRHTADWLFSGGSFERVLAWGCLEKVEEDS